MGNRQAVAKSLQTQSYIPPFPSVNPAQYVNLLFLIAFCLFPQMVLLVKPVDTLFHVFGDCLFSLF